MSYKKKMFYIRDEQLIRNLNNLFNLRVIYPL